ncbi:HNH endonuclease [Mesorhizobium sp. M0046]|uniref:HNH endonuclease n=1 Tax=Mesorhizobium sp. M0046 TaxID=2956858 RepID=UPI003334AFAC
MSANSPRTSTIKRLFALSGNRCAFPKCTAPMAIDETLVGEVCHIKGAKPGSARHDPAQSPEERHAFANLILMCPTHHTVVDDDEESYPVDRLVRLKRDHEEQAKPSPTAKPIVSRKSISKTFRPSAKAAVSRRTRSMQITSRCKRPMAPVRYPAAKWWRSNVSGK